MEEIPSWYSPIGHLLATAGIGAGTVAFALSRLSGVSALEAVLVPVAGFVIANGFEWRVHKDVLHKRRFPFGELFDRHTPNHHVVFVEDVGNNARLGKVWSLTPATGALVELAAHDPDRFLAGGSHFLTQDEEASGVLDVTDLFKDVAGYDTKAFHYFLLDTQAHYAITGEVYEGGQLQLMAVPVALVK